MASVASLLGGILLGAAVRPAAAEIPLPALPDWQSTPQGQYATGCALRDLDGDGFPDLVIANGNDMARQPLAVYRSNGGILPQTPTWISADVDYHGHLDLADVDGDGILDCAVAVYLGPSGFNQPGRVKLYRGQGDGTFSALPVWASAESFYCFSVAFGDIDMDGRPDLACTAGEAYTRRKERFRVFRNEGGTLGATPYWMSASVRYALDVTWGDVNGDGILDLAFACDSNPTGGDPETYPVEVYFGTGTTLSTTPGWRAQDGRPYANTLCLGDLNGDGWLDLAVADNNQIAGGVDNGRYKVFMNDGAGNLGVLPSWTSAWGGYGSHVSFVDVDADGDLDLATGGWWQPVRIYENVGGSLPEDPTWQSATSSVIENIVWEDVDNDGLETPRSADFAGDGARRHYVLPRRPVRILDVRIGGNLLAPSTYFASAEQGWLTLGVTPASGEEVRIRYAASSDLDLALSNWDSGIGNYLFRNVRNPTWVADMPALDGWEVVISPNPAPGACRIELKGELAGGIDTPARIEIFTAEGARVRSLTSSTGYADWDGIDDAGRYAGAGTYWVRVARGAQVTSRRLVMLHAPARGRGSR